MNELDRTVNCKGIVSPAKKKIIYFLWIIITAFCGKKHAAVRGVSPSQCTSVEEYVKHLPQGFYMIFK